MSLARLSADSDVYVYECVERGGGFYVCHFCTFHGSREVLVHSRRALRRHLRMHVEAGDKVPKEAFRAVSGKGRMFS